MLTRACNGGVALGQKRHCRLCSPVRDSILRFRAREVTGGNLGIPPGSDRSSRRDGTRCLRARRECKATFGCRQCSILPPCGDDSPPSRRCRTPGASVPGCVMIPPYAGTETRRRSTGTIGCPRTFNCLPFFSPNSPSPRCGDSASI
ncbi:MAG TPA: hypothetical protein VKK79_11655 [Candidatus Lokiarchaeia archaeon]|nr:hypothetical protein [Candidatus Lokiarchaeia archaeon]